MAEQTNKSHLAIDASRSIPEDELSAKASRAGGAGGQHVNTSSTRVEVSWVPGASRVLSLDEQARVAEKLASRLDGSGILRVVASDTRSQRQNRELAETRLAALVRQALVVPRKRKATKPSRGAKQARLNEKKLASKKKSNRRDRDWD
ncbi:MAG: aminoacyl-tRNA hydrolase [Cytophagaceae bacterium]|nr:aminoacyl-tRNA hydrolase [Gemmatimonadaceae bacterium]